MRSRNQIVSLQQVAAVLTWAIVTGLALYIGYRGDSNAPLAAVGGLSLVNLVAMLITTKHSGQPDSRRIPALWVQLLSAFAIGWLLPLSFMPIYTIIWLAIATGTYSLRSCWWFLAGILLAWYGLFSLAWEKNEPVFTVLLYATFHLFAMLTARNATEAEAARAQVESLNSDLLATQQLLADASRQQERTRIARDLHDMLGHHLTALSLNLQIAERLATGEARTRVEESRALARLLLSDVRDAVSTLREGDGVDLAAALAIFAEHSPGLDVEIDIATGVVVDDVDVAQVIVRCAQEAMTNTMKHASAKRLTVRVWQEDSQTHIEVHDDGQVASTVTEGNGLTGMRERLAAVGGTLQLDNSSGALRLHAAIPFGD